MNVSITMMQGDNGNTKVTLRGCLLYQLFGNSNDLSLQGCILPL